MSWSRVSAAVAGVAAMVTALCLPLADATANEAGSKPYEWRNVTVGAGGFAPNVIFSGAEPDLAYLRTDMGGAHRWVAHQKRWIPLQDGNPVSSYMGIESIAADPANPEVVYLAAVRGVWRSDDGGATWLRINDEAHQWGLRFRAISGDPRRYGRVYIATDGRGLLYGDPASRTGD